MPGMWWSPVARWELSWGSRIGGTFPWLCRRWVTPVCVETEAGLIVVVAGGQGRGVGPWETLSRGEQGISTGLSLAAPAAAPHHVGGVYWHRCSPAAPTLCSPQPWPLSGTSTPGASSCLAKTNPSFLRLNSGGLFRHPL